MKSLVMPAFGAAKMENTSPSSTTFPCSMTATLSQISLTTAISWVMITMVIPSFSFKCFKSCKIAPVVCGSRALVASSQRRTFGSFARALAIATLCFCPPESWLGYAFSFSAISTNSKSSFTFALICCFVSPLPFNG